MRGIDREEWMTAKATWDPSKLDNVEGTVERLLKQFPLLLWMLLIVSILQSGIRATKTDLEVDPVVIGDICATKSVLEVDPAVSNAQDESSEKRGDGYRPKPSEEYNQNLK